MIKRVVFDIECSGISWNSLSEKSKNSLIRHCEGDKNCEEKEKENLALWPITGKIITIAVLDVDSGDAQVFFDSNKEVADFEEDGVKYKSGNEKQIIEWFFDYIKYSDQIITFSGRRFDCPYIIFRSMVHNLRPTFDLMPNRYGNNRKGFNPHLDLSDQLSYFGGIRKFSLHLICESLGITSPKGDGIDGSQVESFYNKGEYKKIARYCMRDVFATAELMKKWDGVQVN